jgi:uncharacterized membrane protein
LGLELNYLFQLPLWLTVFQVAFGEFVVVTLIGVMMYKKFFIGRDWFEKMVE